ncbi:hypothetical protein JCM8547_005521 [Rhodosporidiobolus lusitaniae]
MERGEREMSICSLSSLSHDEEEGASPTSSSTSYRQTVLFPSDSAWPSSDAFFSSCRTRLAKAYGWNAHIMQRETASDGVWVLEDDECIWLHSHECGTYEPEEDEDDEAFELGQADDQADLEEEEAEKEEAEEATTGTVSGIKQLPMPGLPRPGDRFPSSTEFYISTVKAVSHIYGYSVKAAIKRARAGLYCNCDHRPRHVAKKCLFKLLAVKEDETGDWVVQEDGSHFEHNHDARPEILENPNWLPTVASGLFTPSPTSYGAPQTRIKPFPPQPAFVIPQPAFTSPQPAFTSPSFAGPSSPIPSTSSSAMKPTDRLSPSDLTAFLVSLHPSFHASFLSSSPQESTPSIPSSTSQLLSRPRSTPSSTI